VTSVGDCGSFGPFAGNWSHGILGVLQQYLPGTEVASPIRDVRNVTIGQPLLAHAAKRVETHSLTMLAASDNSSLINVAAASLRAVRPLNSAVMPSME
jgi:hypothetical protein